MASLSSQQSLTQTQNHQTAGVMSVPVPVPEIAAGLLIQHSQKLRKPAPVYQTQNERSEHLPMFRSTVVWVDGVSYTSSNTFRQRKNAEMDASRVAYITITQKDKTNALKFIREDKIFCKSVMAEYAVKKNIGKPVYETSQPETSLPVFRSNLVFNGDTYPGDGAKSKKEAEQLVAHSVIINFLVMEAATDMVDIVNSSSDNFRKSTVFPSASVAKV